MSYFNKYIIFSLYPECKDAYYNEYDIEKYQYGYNYTTISFLISYSKIEYYKTFLHEYIIDEKIANQKYEQYKLCFNLQQVMNRFIHKVKLRYSKSNNDKNSYLCDFDKDNPIYINENGKKYTFDIVEMRNIITKTIYNIQDNNVMYNKIKNPYTNIEFSYETLVQIYLYFLKYDRKIPDIFIKLFNLNFDYNKLYSQYYYDIMWKALENNFNNTTPRIKRAYMRQMVTYYGSVNYINVNINILNNIFYKFLKTYYIAVNFTSVRLLPIEVMEKYKKLKIFFSLFMRKNPKFGRKVLTKDITKNKITTVCQIYCLP